MEAGSARRSAAPGNLPALFELAAPDEWRAVDFISDLHLCEAMPRTFDAWARHLKTTPADAIFILGDLFDVWVGDDVRSHEFERRCVETLAEAACHRRLAFMPGNRDFLVGTAMLRDSGAIALPDPSVLDAWGHRIMLSHGDALCLSDESYQTFRQEVRGARWQADFLSRPLGERLAIAAEMRSVSSTRRQFDGAADADLDVAETVRWMHGLGSAELVHGHTHRPGSSLLAPGYKRHVLSDWDLDTSRRAEVLRLDRTGFTRLLPSGS
jgi:UDP-2,3-diacylglucosamine hydrolase